MAQSKKNPFSDLSLEGMGRYSERDAAAKRVKRAAELDERIREFSSREKNADWIKEAPLFCESETLANKDIFDLSKEAYRLPLIKEEAEGLAKMAEDVKMAKIEAESRARRAKMEADAEERALKDKLAREAKEKEDAREAAAFDKTITKLEKSERTDIWRGQVGEALKAAAALSESVKLLVKGLARLDAMGKEAEEILKAAKAKAEKKAADEAKARAEREAELSRIENEKKVAKAKADAEAARIAAEREAAAAREKAAREAEEEKARAARAYELAKIENERKVAKAKADAEAARIAAEREAEAAREKAAREAEEEKARAAREAELSKIENEKRVAKAKADAEEARIKAERDAKAKEEERLRRAADEKDRLARIEAEAKEKALREKIKREEEDRRNNESAADMDDLIVKLSKAPRTKLWIAEVKKAYKEAEALPTDAKLMVAGLDNLEEMYAEAKGREKAKEMEVAIDKLCRGARDTVPWAREVVLLHSKIDYRKAERGSDWVAARPYISNLQALEQMNETAEIIVKDDDVRAEVRRLEEERLRYEAEAKAKKERAEAEAKAERERAKAEAKAHRKAKMKKVGESIVSGAKTLGKILIIAAIIALGVTLSVAFSKYTALIVPATVGVALFTVSRYVKTLKKARLLLIIDIIAAITAVIFIILGGAIRLSAMVLGIYIFAKYVYETVRVSIRKYKPKAKDDNFAVVFSDEDYDGTEGKSSESVKKFYGAGMALVLVGGVLTSLAAALGMFGGDGIYLAIGIGFAITLASWFVIEKYCKQETLGNILAIGVPIVTVAISLSAKRPLVFVGFAVICGYIVGQALKIAIGMSQGENYAEALGISRYDHRGITQARETFNHLSLVVCLVASIAFFAYVGYTDYIVDGNGVLKKGFEMEDTVVIPDDMGITEIGDNAFNNMKHGGNANGQIVKTLVIPEGVTEIGKDAFYWHVGLEEIYLPSTLKKIDGLLLRGSSSSELKIYYAGNDNSELENKIIIVNENSNVFTEMFNGFKNNCNNVKWVCGYDYTAEFYLEEPIED